MERVEDWRLIKSLKRECKVDDNENETTILHKETQRNPFVLKFESCESKILLSILIFKLLAIWSFSK